MKVRDPDPTASRTGVRLQRRKYMDTASLVNGLLLVVGFGALLHRDAIAKHLAAEISLQEIGVARTEQEWVWSGVALVAGLALVMTALLRFVA